MKEDLLYSKNKVLRHLKKLERINNKKVVAPLLVRIDLTNACNQRCTYCMYQQSLPKFGLCNDFSFKDSIKFSEIKKLIEDLSKLGSKAIMFTGGGEPTIHPKIKEIIELTLKNNLEVGLITNGAKIDYSWKKLLKNEKFKWVRISLDAAKQKTWEKVHRPLAEKKFNEIISTIKKIKKDKKIKTKIGASFVINDLNWKEIIPFAKLCKKNNFDDIRISFTYQIKREKFYKKSKDKILGILNLVKRLESNNFSINILKSRLESLQGKCKSYKKCYFAHFSTSIGANMKIYPCCMTKYAKKFEIGDLRKEKFDEKFLKGWFSKINKIRVNNCPTCWYDNFNELCNYYCLNTAEYSNFIN